MRPLAQLGISEPLHAAAESILPVISSTALPPCAATVNSTEEQFALIFVHYYRKTPLSLLTFLASSRSVSSYFQLISS